MADADATSPSDDDYRALEQALNAGSRGRAFLRAYAARARALDADALGGAIAEIERVALDVSMLSDAGDVAALLRDALQRLRGLLAVDSDVKGAEQSTSSLEQAAASPDPWRIINAMTEREKLALFS